MRKYIILTNSITNMGGGQMFAANKSIYFREHGWDVSIYFSNPKGDIFIPELKRYGGNLIPEIGIPFNCLSKKERNNVILKIKNDVSSASEVVIESHTHVCRYWGEYIAKSLNCKHIIDDLGENLPELNDKQVEYLEWKLKRREILNVNSEKSLRRYFGSKYKNEYLSYIHDYMVLAYCSNVTTNIDADLSQIPKADYTILSIGRLDKPYILPSVKEIIAFAKEYKDNSFNLLFVGGSTKGITDKLIHNICKDIPNLHVHHFGYVFPVPENIIDSSDIAFASSNSVLVSADRGVPTISIDVHDMLPIGIYGKTTNSHFSRGLEPTVSFKELLRQVLKEKRFVKEKKDNAEEKKLFNTVFEKQTAFLSISPNDGVSYDVEKLFPLHINIIGRIKLFVLKLIRK